MDGSQVRLFLRQGGFLPPILCSTIMQSLRKIITLRITNTVAVSLLGYWLFFARQALANRSQFAIGIDAFGSTINNNDGDRR